MSQASIYQQREAVFNIKLQGLKRYNLLFILLKLALFLSILVLMYQWMVHGWSLWWALGATVAFGVVFKIDQRFMKHLRLIEALQHINEQESAAQEGDLRAFEAGTCYADGTHAYSFDLDLFVPGGIYQYLNRTVTQEGADALAGYLAHMSTKETVIRARQAAIVELSPLLEWRQMFAALGHHATVSLKGVLQHLREQPKDVTPVRSLWQWSSYLFIGFTFGALTLNVLGLVAYQLPLVLMLAQLMLWGSRMKATNRIHGRIDRFYQTFSGYNELLSHVAKPPAPFESDKLKEIAHQLTSPQTGAREAFAELGRILGSFNQRNNLLVSMVLNGLVMRDVLLMMRYRRWMHRWAADFPMWVDALAEMDALVSLANYAYNHPGYAIPQLSTDEVLAAHDLGHPLISAQVRVCNDYRVDAMPHFHLVTGANMAGKSTFLRAVGVNLILASCGAPVCASQFRFRPMQLFSSMRTSDNLVNHTSYFQAELLRLKQLLDAAASSDGLFVILDEMLKGTNSRDKLAGSRLFLLKMLGFQSCGLVATHDLALGDLVQERPGRFTNICFEITIGHDDIIYDYRLKPGLAHNLNATWLLERLIGHPDSDAHL